MFCRRWRWRVEGVGRAVIIDPWVGNWLVSGFVRGMLELEPDGEHGCCLWCVGRVEVVRMSAEGKGDKKGHDWTD